MTFAVIVNLVAKGAHLLAVFVPHKNRWLIDEGVTEFEHLVEEITLQLHKNCQKTDLKSL
jgi:hypothetical protein